MLSHVHPFARCGALLLALLVSGCAYVTAVPVKNNEYARGIRIYDAKPILIVTSDSADVKLVPNYNRAYALRFGAFLAKNTSNFTFENGTIKALNSTLDSTAAVTLLQTLGKAVIDKLPASAFSTQRDKGIGAPQRFAVFSFDFDAEGNLIGLRPLLAADDLIRVPKATVRQAAAAAQGVNPALSGTGNNDGGPGFPTNPGQ
ncbi:MAG: hypothetical protein AAGF28_13090 [Pseudomonadota bacterium]